MKNLKIIDEHLELRSMQDIYDAYRNNNFHKVDVCEDDKKITSFFPNTHVYKMTWEPKQNRAFRRRRGRDMAEISSITSEQEQLLESYGFTINSTATKRDDEDTVFTTPSFVIADSPDFSQPNGDDVRFIKAYGSICFEPKCVGGVADNWNVCIATSDDFFSNNDTWPDSFDSLSDALTCYNDYFSFHGKLNRCGYTALRDRSESVSDIRADQPQSTRGGEEEI